MYKVLIFLFKEQKSNFLPTLFSALILLLLSLHIFIYAYFPVAGYDMAKVIWKFHENPTLISFIIDLKFIQGIGALTYAFLSLGLGISGLKIIDFLLLISASFFVVNFFLNKKVNEALLLSLIVGVVFLSDVIAYLGSYGMIIYMVNLWTGSFLLWLIKHKRLLNVKFPSLEAFLIILAMSVFTFIDIRASFYFCMGYLILLLSHLREAKVRNLIIHGLIAGLFLLLPIYSQLLLFEKIHKLQPHHVQSLLFSGGSVLSFIGNNLLNLVETLLGGNFFYQLFFLIFFFTGILISLRKKEDQELLLLLVLPLTVQMLASLFKLYPFGSIRYCLPLIPFIIYFALKGGKALLNLNSKFTKVIVLLTCLCIFISITDSVRKRIISHVAVAKAGSDIVKKYKYNKNIKLFTDIVTEKLALSNNVIPTAVISTWNIVKRTQEENNFYNQFEAIIRNEKKIYLLLFLPIENNYFKALREVLNENGFKIVDHKNSISQFWYEIEKQK